MFPRACRLKFAGATVGKFGANIIWRCRSASRAMLRVRCGARSGADSRLRFGPLQLLARRRSPGMGLLVALGVAIEGALEIAERDHEPGPAVLEAALDEIVLQK